VSNLWTLNLCPHHSSYLADLLNTSFAPEGEKLNKLQSLQYAVQLRVLQPHSHGLFCYVVIPWKLCDSQRYQHSPYFQPVKYPPVQLYVLHGDWGESESRTMVSRINHCFGRINQN